jgi:hypothetical protein
MKKQATIIIILLLFAVAGNAQILTPVHWSYAAKKISSTEAVVFIKCTIDDGWHVYSQTVKEGGPERGRPGKNDDHLCPLGILYTCR